MPEFGDVHGFERFLNEDVVHGRFPVLVTLTNGEAPPAQFRVRSIETHGKSLWFFMDDESGKFAKVSFGLNGFLTSSPDVKYSRGQITIEPSGGQPVTLFLANDRNAAPGWSIAIECSETCDPDLGQPEHFARIASEQSRRRANICSVLMDQKKGVAGIGNTVKSEVLHMERVAPSQTAQQVGAPKITAMFERSRELALAISERMLARCRETEGRLTAKDWHAASACPDLLQIYKKGTLPDGTHVNITKTPDGRETYHVL
jgi:formamidopyrimidine-DNA glycosylase